MKNKDEKRGPDRAVFEAEIQRLLADEEIRKMGRFTQHQGTSTLQHVKNVAYRSFELAEKFGWDIDEKKLARGALLHDYYLYTFKQADIGKYRHGTGHPKKALENAREHFDLSEKEENIIRSHMWPLTLFHAPHSREAVLVCLADKECAAKEMLGKKNLEGRKTSDDGGEIKEEVE